MSTAFLSPFHKHRPPADAARHRAGNWVGWGWGGGSNEARWLSPSGGLARLAGRRGAEGQERRPGWAQSPRGENLIKMGLVRKLLQGGARELSP